MAAPRVLLIESDSGTAVPLGAALRAIGAEVSSVPDGETGLQLAESTLPQLVVLAVELPGISGYSVCKNLRRSPTTGLLPIFLMSTTATEEIFAQHKRLPTRATEYFTKPLNVDALVEAARGVLGIEAAPADDLAGLIENEIAQALESDLFAPDDSVLPDAAAAVETSRGGGQATPAVSVDVVRLSRPTVDSAAAGEAAAEELGAARRAQADAEARLSDSMARAQEAEASVARLELTVATSAAQLAAVEQRAAAAEERARAAEARATEPPRAASDSTSATSARELLTLREALNGKEREVLELKDEIFKRD
ncbi:MAG: response regulator, partial [Myxococcales bacterium]|nr:response regulator [Myxococcales bacterium]